MATSSDPVLDDADIDDPSAASPAWEQDEWLAHLDPTAEGLEIGPLYTPRFPKDRYQVRYVDHASTEELRAKYATDDFMANHLDEIVDVDFIWTGGAPLAEVVGDAGPFDYVFASHVIEHAPDLIGWLRDVGAVLADGGQLCLAIPDKRLCFDVNRDLTGMSDLVDAHLRRLTAPSYRQIYDFHSRIVEVDAAALWAGTGDYRGQWRTDLDPDQWGYEQCLKHQQTGEYIDGHCWVFTPSSFLDLYARLVALDLVDYRIASFTPSVWGTIEFRVVLEKLPATMDAATRRAAQLASVPTFVDTVPPAPGDVAGMSSESRPPDAVDEAAFEPSPREVALLKAKRRVVETARSLPGRLRRRTAT